MNAPRYDLIAMGRSSLDLYSNNVGAPFVDIKEFGAFVGGCPLNISVGARRLGLNTALLTAFGADPVGDFIEHFLKQEGVETRFIPRKPERRTSAVVLGIEPPDKFPLVFYRDNCADVALSIDDVQGAPFETTRALLLSGTGLSQEPGRSATLFAAERAQEMGLKVFLDVDFRADQWHDPRAFGVNVRALLPRVDVVIGTEEELKVAALSDALEISIEGAQVSSPTVSGDLEHAVETALGYGVQALVVKRGTRGARAYLSHGQTVAAEPFTVEVLSVLGAGDAFASGLIYGVLRGWSWPKCLRMGNACGAIVVTRPGCANFMPHEQEVLDFVAARGGF